MTALPLKNGQRSCLVWWYPSIQILALSFILHLTQKIWDARSKAVPRRMIMQMAFRRSVVPVEAKWSKWYLTKTLAHDHLRQCSKPGILSFPQTPIYLRCKVLIWSWEISLPKPRAKVNRNRQQKWRLGAVPVPGVLLVLSLTDWVLCWNLQVCGRLSIMTNLCVLPYLCYCKWDSSCCFGVCTNQDQICFLDKAKVIVFLVLNVKCLM